VTSSVAPIPPVSAVRYCNLVSAISGEHVIGNAPLWHTSVALEVPMRNWEVTRDRANMTPHRLETLGRAAKLGHGFGLLLFETAATKCSRTSMRVVVTRRETNTPGGYSSTTYEIAPDNVDALLEAALLEPARLEAFARVESPREERLLLMCTHARVDAACAKFGIPLQRYLERLQGSDVIAARCAHFGGHRFAPTLVELPSNRLWGRLTKATLETLATRRGDLEMLLTTAYRGWAALDGFTQFVEQRAWLETGWDWLTYRVSGRVTACEGAFDPLRFVYPTGLESPPAWVQVRLEALRPDGSSLAFTGVVERAADASSLGTTNGEAVTYKQFRLSSFTKETA
jgi:hypothetical protein